MRGEIVDLLVCRHSRLLLWWKSSPSQRGQFLNVKLRWEFFGRTWWKHRWNLEMKGILLANQCSIRSDIASTLLTSLATIQLYGLPTWGEQMLLPVLRTLQLQLIFWRNWNLAENLIYLSQLTFVNLCCHCNKRLKLSWSTKCIGMICKDMENLDSFYIMKVKKIPNSIIWQGLTFIPQYLKLNQFGSSVDEPGPSTLGVEDAIPGWQLAWSQKK